MLLKRLVHLVVLADLTFSYYKLNLELVFLKNLPYFHNQDHGEYD